MSQAVEVWVRWLFTGHSRCQGRSWLLLHSWQWFAQVSDSATNMKSQCWGALKLGGRKVASGAAKLGGEPKKGFGIGAKGSRVDTKSCVK